MQLNTLFDFLGKSFIPQGDETAKNAGSGEPSGGFGSALAAALGFSTPGSGAATDADAVSDDGTADDGLLDGLSLEIASAEASSEGAGEENDANPSKLVLSDADVAIEAASADVASENQLQNSSLHPDASSVSESDALASGSGTDAAGSDLSAEAGASSAGDSSISPEAERGTAPSANSASHSAANSPANASSNFSANAEMDDASPNEASSNGTGTNPTRASENLPASGAATQGQASHPPREVAAGDGPTPDAPSDEAASADALSLADERTAAHDSSDNMPSSDTRQAGTDRPASGGATSPAASEWPENGNHGRTTQAGGGSTSSGDAPSSETPDASGSGTVSNAPNEAGPSNGSAQAASTLGQPNQATSAQGPAAQTEPTRTRGAEPATAAPESSARPGNAPGPATTEPGGSIDSASSRDLPSEPPRSTPNDTLRSASARTDGQSEHGTQAGTATQPSSTGVTPESAMPDGAVQDDASVDPRPSETTAGSDQADVEGVDPDAAAEMAARNGDERPLRSNRADGQADRKNGVSPSVAASQGQQSFSDQQSGSFSNARDQQLAPRPQDQGSQAVDATDFQDALDERPADEPLVTSQAEETAFTPEQKSSPASVFSLDAAQSSSRARTTGTMAWLRSLLAQSTRSLSLSQGWKSIEVQLEDGMGTMTVRARRGDDGVAVSVHFSDPNLRSLAETNVQRLQEALRSEYEANVDLSLMSDGSTDTPDRQNPSGSDRRNLRSILPDALPGEVLPESGAPTRPTLAGARNEWIG
ncbi:MAG: hypothetical protein WD423_04800 [Rhodothermales bacterium]